MSYGCGCGNPWDNNGSTRNVCGEFPEPTNPDQGRCSPYRVKILNEAPALPVAQCEDEEYTTIYQPENTEAPFVVSARLFDECCEVIADENGNPITLIIDKLGGYAAGTCP